MQTLRLMGWAPLGRGHRTQIVYSLRLHIRFMRLWLTPHVPKLYIWLCSHAPHTPWVCWTANSSYTVPQLGMKEAQGQVQRHIRRLFLFIWVCKISKFQAKFQLENTNYWAIGGVTYNSYMNKSYLFRCSNYVSILAVPFLRYGDRDISRKSPISTYSLCRPVHIPR